MTYRIFYLNQYLTARSTRGEALDFIAACSMSRREDFEILDASDVVTSFTTSEAEYLVEAAHQYQETLFASHSACLHLVGSMRRSYANGMSIVELARISGFSRPTVMKYVQNVTTTPVEP